MFDGNEIREVFLKMCMENILKIYMFMLNFNVEIVSEDEFFDD